MHNLENILGKRENVTHLRENREFLNLKQNNNYNNLCGPNNVLRKNFNFAIKGTNLTITHQILRLSF